MVNDPIVETALKDCIFKYGPAEYVERTLTDKTLGFSSLDDFNDPYESDYRIVHFFHSLEDEKELLDPPVSAFTNIQQLINDYLKNIRVTCFSRTPINSLMWSHYSTHHSGVCYAFERTQGSHPFDPEKLTWGNVIYASLLPEIKIFQDQTTKGMLPPLLSDVILTKSQDWAYEQEFRFFKALDGNALNFRVSSLKAIILGRRISDSDEKSIVELVDNFNKSNGQEVRVLFAHRIARSFSLGIHSNSGFQKSSEDSFSASIPVLDNICSEAITTRK